MSKLLLLLIASACATTGRTMVDTDPATRARVALEFSGHADTAAVFPAALDPALPSVDRIGREVRGTLGDRATAHLDLCVSPAGRVTKVALARSSSFADFDAALLHDVEAWRFAKLPGPASLESCERAKITYHPY